MAGRPSKQATVSAVQYQCGGAQSAYKHPAFVEVGPGGPSGRGAATTIPGSRSGSRWREGTLVRLKRLMGSAAVAEKTGACPRALRRPAELSAEPRAASRPSGGCCNADRSKVSRRDNRDRSRRGGISVARVAGATDHALRRASLAGTRSAPGDLRRRTADYSRLGPIGRPRSVLSLNTDLSRASKRRDANQSAAPEARCGARSPPPPHRTP